MDNMSKRIQSDNPTQDDALNDPLTDFDSVDQLLGFKSRIIFSEEAYEHLKSLIVKCAKSGSETGCLFLGKESNSEENQILIDCYTSDMKTADASFSGGAVEVTPENFNELSNKIANEGYNCAFHFHTHIPKGYFEIVSDNDLNAYEALASSPFTLNHGVSFFGILAAPNRSGDNYQVSTIYCSPSQKQNAVEFEYYKFPNIYYVKDEVIYEMGKYQRTNAPVLSNGRQIAQTPVVQAIGNYPYTNQNIEDVPVGLCKEGCYRFSADHVSLIFPESTQTKTR